MEMSIGVGREVVMSEILDSQDDMSEDELDQIIKDMSEGEDDVQPPMEKSKESSSPVMELVQSKKVEAAGEPVKVAPVSMAAQQTLSLEMNGVINLKLCFKNGDRSVEVQCTEDFLVCRMADGTEFRIPTGSKNMAKAA